MHNLPQLIGNGLVLTGILVLAVTLIPLWKLLKQLPSGQVYTQWRLLAALVLFFIAGYILYAALNWNSSVRAVDLMVPAIFYFGAIFVLMVSSLSLNTARDIVRICTLQEENITDPLMGIFNRRYLERRLKEEGLRAKRYNQPLSILLLDIDNFKEVNDTYGHQGGDFVLEKLGQVMLDSIRESDMVARYGGDEILVILPNTSDAEAFHFAERLRQTVEKYNFLLPENRGERKAINITVSIGVTGFNQFTMDCQSFVENVDKALYQAKDGGRNMVSASDDMFDLAA